MEIAWAGGLCGPKGCEGGNICFLHHTHISRENPSKPKFQSWSHFISPKPTFPSWECLSPPNPNIKVEKTFHPRSHSEARRICFLHNPKLRNRKYSVVHKNQTSKVGCAPKMSISMFRFWKPRFQRWKHELSVQNTLFKMQPICCQCTAQVSKLNIYEVWNI